DEDRNVVELDLHVWMLLKRLARIGFVVLGTHRKNDALVLQFQNVPLERDERFAFGRALAESNARQAVFADHAAHSVLSRSSTRHFLLSPRSAASTAAVCPASSGNASSDTACLAMC